MGQGPLGHPSRGGRAWPRAPSDAARHGPRPAAIEGTPGSWAEWVQRWYATSTLTPKIQASYRSVLVKIGRSLAAEPPECPILASTRQVCASWVATVDRMTVGDYSQWTHGMCSRDWIGKPLTPESKSGYLKVPRAFFRDLHEWEWIRRRFAPAAEALRDLVEADQLPVLGAGGSLRAPPGPGVSPRYRSGGQSSGPTAG